MTLIAQWNFSQIGDKILKNLSPNSNPNTLVRSGKIPKKLIPFKAYGLLILGTNAPRKNHLYIAQADATDLDFVTNEQFTFYLKYINVKTGGRLMFFNKGMYTAWTQLGYQFYTKPDSDVQAFYQSTADSNPGYVGSSTIYTIHIPRSSKINLNGAWSVARDNSTSRNLRFAWESETNRDVTMGTLYDDDFTGSLNFVIGNNCDNIVEYASSAIIENLMIYDTYEINNYHQKYKHELKKVNKMKSLSHMLFN